MITPSEQALSEIDDVLIEFTKDGSARSPIWALGQISIIVGLFEESRGEPLNPPHAPGKPRAEATR